MRGIARIIGFIFATGALLFVVAAAVFAGVLWKYEQELPDYSVLKNYEPPVMTRVHAADGSLLAEYSRERRLYLPSDEIPDLVKHAFISAEDKNFYQPLGRRSRGHRARGHHLPGGLAPHPGRLDHHPAGGQELSFELGPDFRSQDPRDSAELANRVRLLQGKDPRTLPQRDLPRPLQLRRRRRRARLFQQVGARTDHRGSRLSGGVAEGAEFAEPVPRP